MKQTTLSIMIRDNQICLGKKLRGFAEGIYNGMGGKVELGETPTQGIIREIKEEINIDISEKQLIYVGILHFIVEKEPKHSSDIHLFKITNFDGEPQKTDEIEPIWFPIDDIPYEKMWEDDKTWLPRIINGEEDIEYNVIFETISEGMKELRKIK
ncbi:8-oxo-dGTP diphosphatase [Candidatus Gracilibacteria bacterium]|nr:8-oxo-dGTP diphosphatase [Candidatus Gracilibacteria bacterium]